MNDLELLTSCGFIVLRIVTDDFSANVKLFKILCNGTLSNSIPHPFLAPIPLFLISDYCNALKNAINLFLQREMNSSAGIISSEYLKKTIWPSKRSAYKTSKEFNKKTFISFEF